MRPFIRFKQLMALKTHVGYLLTDDSDRSSISRGGVEASHRARHFRPGPSAGWHNPLREGTLKSSVTGYDFIAYINAYLSQESQRLSDRLLLHLSPTIPKGHPEDGTDIAAAAVLG